MTQTWHTWTQKEIDTLRALYPDHTAQHVAEVLGLELRLIYYKARHLGVKKSAGFLAGPQSGRLDGIRGAETRFQAGGVSWNRGKKGLQIGGLATQFQPGHRGGMAALRYQPIGSERIQDGYLQRKVRDDGPVHRRWEFVHRLVWIEHHGPIPDGHVVTFRNGNRLDIEPQNLELITRADLTRRNSIHRYPRELRDAMKLAARLRRKIDDHAKQ
ncbi:MAG: HNH endonuclease signature motif containing protein [Pseudomonadota bacterium]|nr:HNH endonuclease signature motif containing protein [Pseudomonadota bacterium]